MEIHSVLFLNAKVRHICFTSCGTQTSMYTKLQQGDRASCNMQWILVSAFVTMAHSTHSAGGALRRKFPGIDPRLHLPCERVINAFDLCLRLLQCHLKCCYFKLRLREWSTAQNLLQCRRSLEGRKNSYGSMGPGGFECLSRETR